MPERKPLERGDSDKTKEDQMSNKFAHRANKEETYNPKRTEVPTADNFREGEKMIFQNKFLMISFLTFSLTLGCAQQDKVAASQKQSRKNDQEEQSRITTNSTASEVGAKNYTEINFYEGSSALSESAKKSLTSALNESSQKGKIDEVIVLSWADENYPSEEVKKLSKEQRNLADLRNKNVKDYLKMMKDVDVKSYNMAERPSSFSKLFNNADSELKNSMLEAGLSTTADKADYSSKASHSVILIKTKE